MQLSEYNDLAPTFGLARHFRCLLFTIHGFNTRASWQRDINVALTKAGFLHIPIDLGRFIWIFFPCTRLRLRRCEQLIRSAYAQHHDDAIRFGSAAVAHSFGTLALAETLRRDPSIQIRRIVLIASLLPSSYPWIEVKQQNRIERVRVEITPTDTWVRLARYVVCGSGPSGIEGFECDEDVVEAVEYLDTSHSRLLSATHCRTSWIPFLS